ncbi:MAG: DUF3605 domain-containing protein [Patescibacteria group bacterium]
MQIDNLSQEQQKVWKILNSERNVNLEPQYVRGKFISTLYNIYKKTVPSSIRKNILKKQIEEGVFRNVSITGNMFPYKKLLANGTIKHFIIWNNVYLENFEKSDLEPIVEEFLHNHKIKHKSVFFLRNPMELKSVKDIDHFHIFVFL